MRIFMLLALRFAAKRTAICSKIDCDLRQNALRLGANCIAFCTILQGIWLLIADYPHNLCANSTYICNSSFYRPVPFCAKTNPRENRLFAAE